METTISRYLPFVFAFLGGYQIYMGQINIGILYLGIGAGTALFNYGAKHSIRPAQLLGAGLSAFSAVILIWLAFFR